MIDDYNHAASLQARHEASSHAPELDFKPDAHARSIAACAGALKALGVELDRTDLVDILAEHIHDENTTSPECSDDVYAEWVEARLTAEWLINEYAATPVAAGTWLMGARFMSKTTGDVMEKVK